MKKLIQKLGKLRKSLFNKKTGMAISMAICIILVYPEFGEELQKFELMLRVVGCIFGLFGAVIGLLIWSENRDQVKEPTNSNRSSIKIPVVF